MRSEIKRWGNSAALRLPGKILAEARLEISSPVTIVVKGKKIIIEASGDSRPKHLKLPFNEAALLKGLNTETAHADEVIPLLDSEFGD